MSTTEEIQDYSQHGEARIILELLSELPERNHWCVDVGAGSGFSNVRALIESCKYSAVLFEADTEEFSKLSELYEFSVAMIVIRKRCVGFTDGDGLDRLLFSTLLPIDFDFLSIDIDGNDFHVWLALETYRPKIVCIEFNPTIPNEIYFVQAADRNVNQGCSLSALVDLGKQKGYQLAACTEFNAFFVRDEYFPLMKIADNRPEVLRTDMSRVSYMFHGYDGHVFVLGCERLVWHPIWWNDQRFQVLPKYLQHPPWFYSMLQRILFYGWAYLQMFRYRS